MCRPDPDESIWRAHQEAKRALLAYVEGDVARRLRLDVPLIGFARRMTDYKRPTLLFSDTERLLAIGRKRPTSGEFAGSAHPRDGDGQHLIESSTSAFVSYRLPFRSSFCRTTTCKLRPGWWREPTFGSIRRCRR